jgi:hypothetical protein
MPDVRFDAGEDIFTAWFSGTSSDEGIRAYLDAYTRLLQRGRRIGAVIDGVGVSSMSPVQRAMHAEWLRANKPMLSKWCVGTAFVLESALSRGIVTAILWVQPLSAPHRVFGKHVEARRWIVAQFGAAKATA